MTKKRSTRPTAGGSAHEALIARLVALGIARNEARAYLTLLQDDSGEGLTGYEVAARSGIPRSAVYTVLRKLEEAGAAFAYGDSPARFVAIDPARWIERMRQGADQGFSRALEALSSLPTRERPEPVWLLRRYDEVLGRMEQMIRAARRAVYLSAWARELDRLRPAFEAIEARPLHRVLHSPAPLTWRPQGFACWIDAADDASRAAWSHRVVLVVDRGEALIGGAEPGTDNQAVWTSNPSLVDLATHHIVLDITLMARERGVDCAETVAPMMRSRL